MWTMSLLTKDGPAEIPHMSTAPKDMLVWHYTGANGLLGIVESKSFWASSPLTLNDASEITYGARIISNAWDLLRLNRRDMSDTQLALGEFLANEAAIRAATDRVFFLCATRDEDSLNQWQGYSRAQGYAIQLQISEPMAVLVDSTAYNPQVGPYVFQGWFEVVYDKIRQLDMARDLISFCLDHLQADEEGDDLSPKAAHNMFLIASLVVRFKHHAFENEHEVRYVAGLPEFCHEHFRQGPRGLVPYVELTSTSRPHGAVSERGERLPISKVMCGPAPIEEQEPMSAAVKRLIVGDG